MTPLKFSLFYHCLLSCLQLLSCFSENGTKVSSKFILTPLIQSGNLEKAKSLSEVEPFPGFNFTSYAGYLTIDEADDSNMYFWYFLAKMNSENAPIVIFMNGGPGVTSLFGLFGEVGPFYVLPNMTLVGREYDWSKEFNLLIVDFPAGTGFSFTNSVKGYAKTYEDIGRQGFQFLQQFFTLFSEHRKNDLYIAGESFGGSYPFHIARVIDEENSSPNSKLNINLKGIISISGVLDVPAMRFSSEYLYSLGLLTEKDKNFFKVIEMKAKNLCEEGLYHQSIFTLAPLVLTGQHSFMQNLTGYSSLYNINNVKIPHEFVSYVRFLKHPKVKKQIHASDVTQNPESEYVSTRIHFQGSYLKDHIDILKTVLDKNFKVLIMTGQLDGYVPPLYQRRFISNLDWSGKEEYSVAQRIIWRVDPMDEEVAGYVTSARNLVEIMVRKAGHMIPFDNPRASWDALKRFVYNKSFS